jgi:formate dehydrogenase subunit gamma
MRHGYVDEAWAKEHHEYWYDDIKSGKIPAQRTVLTPTSPPITSSQPV